VRRRTVIETLTLHSGGVVFARFRFFTWQCSLVLYVDLTAHAVQMFVFRLFQTFLIGF